MKIFSSLHLLAALGALGAATGASAQVDTSQWKCTSCPYPKGTTGSVDAGVGYVSDSSQKFGDYTGLDEKGAFLVLGGNVSQRGDDGYCADLWGADLGLDSRRLYGAGRPRGPLLPELRLRRDPAPPDRRRERRRSSASAAAC